MTTQKSSSLTVFKCWDN